MGIHRSLFPLPLRATSEGVVAVGGRPDPEILEEAYRRGIFPWPHEGVPLLWFCPDPRFVLIPGRAHVSRSLRKELRRGRFEVAADQDFPAVIRACAARERPEQGGTWINPEMIAGYSALHERGLAHSIEARIDGKLVGGLYGVSLGAVFFGESMFAEVADASKVCFATLLANLVLWDFRLVDCQQETQHLASFGAEPWPRPRFLAELRRAVQAPTKKGAWTLDLGPREAAELWRGGT
ncbi:MAG TPA: leucyl/phenylalanyl-tRNA--protein transferase [Thermoanaerobaculia bacterium]|jgi:leucyl/phenylalanyl-tRNA--protein transferase|nr:leucyl/phenylalanyl-tRNA--protein transferase [Thermoanaerobaculia bacterium]